MYNIDRRGGGGLGGGSKNLSLGIYRILYPISTSQALPRSNAIISNVTITTSLGASHLRRGGGVQKSFLGRTQNLPPPLTNDIVNTSHISHIDKVGHMAAAPGPLPILAAELGHPSLSYPQCWARKSVLT